MSDGDILGGVRVFFKHKSLIPFRSRCIPENSQSAQAEIFYRSGLLSIALLSYLFPLPSLWQNLVKIE